MWFYNKRRESAFFVPRKNGSRDGNGEKKRETIHGVRIAHEHNLETSLYKFFDTMDENSNVYILCVVKCECKQLLCECLAFRSVQRILCNKRWITKCIYYEMRSKRTTISPTLLVTCTLELGHRALVLSALHLSIFIFHSVCGEICERTRTKRFILFFFRSQTQQRYRYFISHWQPKLLLVWTLSFGCLINTQIELRCGIYVMFCHIVSLSLLWAHNSGAFFSLPTFRM